MNNIDAQIKELQHKKKKIDYIKYIEDLVKNDNKCIDFKDVKQDIISQVLPLLKGIAESIETGIQPKTESAEIGFSEDQKIALRELADRYNIAKSQPKQSPVAIQTGATPVQSPYSKEPAPVAPPREQEMNTNDKMNFAMNHRGLANQRVQVLNSDNADIRGLVVGLDAPHIIVKTDAGHTIKVPFERINKI